MTLRLNETDDRLLTDRARAEGRSKQEVAREAIHIYLDDVRRLEDLQDELAVTRYRLREQLGEVGSVTQAEARVTSGLPLGLSEAVDPQVIHFHRKHHESIVSGEKVTTVRWNEAISTGASVFVFDDLPNAHQLPGQVREVVSHRLSELTSEAAHQPPGTDMVLFADQLRANYYPSMPTDAIVQVAVIALDADASRP